MRFRAGLLVFLVAACGNAFSSTDGEALLPPIPSAAVPITHLSANEEIWMLDSDVAIHTQMLAWAKRAGWRLSWNIDRSWLVAAPTQFRGDFELVLQEVIAQLYREGKGVKVDTWTDNRYAEVTSANAY